MTNIGSANPHLLPRWGSAPHNLFKSVWGFSENFQSRVTAEEIKNWTGKLLAKAKNQYVEAVEAFHNASADQEAATVEIKKIYDSYWQSINSWKPITLYKWAWPDIRGEAETGWATTDKPDDKGYVRILPERGADYRYLKLEGTPFPVEKYTIESLEQFPWELYIKMTHELPGYQKNSFWSPDLEQIQLLEKSPDSWHILPIQEIIPIPAIIELLESTNEQTLTEREFCEIASGWKYLLGIDVPPVEEFEAILKASSDADNTDDLTRCLKSLEALKQVFSEKQRPAGVKCTEKAIAIFKARLNALT